MAPIKASLETDNCLAKVISKDSNVRFNSVNAGPLKTELACGNSRIFGQLCMLKDNISIKKALQTKVANLYGLY